MPDTTQWLTYWYARMRGRSDAFAECDAWTEYRSALDALMEIAHLMRAKGWWWIH